MAALRNELSWYVVHTKPWKELLVADHLEKQLDLEVFLPEVLRFYRNEWQFRPFFPRYLFVRADLNIVEASAIHYSPGVIGLISFGNAPQPVAHKIVEEIRQRIETLNAQGGMPRYDFRVGDKVRVVDGPLRGLEAVFQRPMRSGDRVRILLEFLGRLREVEVPAAHLEKVGSSHFIKAKRRRRTRGRGRRIRYSTSLI
ncbi:MAG: hypothetical protein GXP42_07080 [Chloroflexi bacterium]|nr:hypothetical protein [Chloroflexota bacterium]